MLEAILQSLVAPFGSVQELFDMGGPVLWWISAAAVLMWVLIVERWWYFLRGFPRMRKRLAAAWQARTDRRSWYARRIRMLLVSQAQIEMNAGVQLMSVVIPMCPLLGLVGTVSGMMEVFDAMSLRGRVDPQTLAGGIGHAMIATLAGLAVSLSGMGFVHYFRERVRHETEALNELLEPTELESAA
ncbi:MAG TPA: MotA/TolQ/ExbB proton channel family protein [Solimonas sp.]|nr:MotA/TolQ/ExbB proton channel family protein [Solimonas sp.]